MFSVLNDNNVNNPHLFTWLVCTFETVKNFGFDQTFTTEF